MAKDAGLDLYSLRFEDGSESRRAWLVANPGPPVPKMKRAPVWRPLGKAKELFVPKWKQERLAALPEEERKAALQKFAARWSPAPLAVA
jgi:hypothetical protein